ncbi:GNAT family N-acetyltransferase [Rossellomorea vietnamensis]|uniref:GNAT family N-acetyltransferase n=1 Tax=Rossellomorea vietnamensis TaxID=218284 RepID=A0A5D4MBX2_9BACI|nr:GNAT family protein [Rossellomorea vietnamensis]TYR99222.1 GNAT family N-acetyltransferase [Rossellomorea vietnamensis]
MIRFEGTPLLETNRLILRKLELTDAEIMFDRWLSDERVSDNRVSPAHKSVTETIEKLKTICGQYSNEDFCYWGMELKESGELIGEIDLYDFDEQTINCDVSYSVGPDWWNNGYASEALREVVRFAFNTMNVHKISAAHNTDNPSSGKVMLKAGMNQEGIVRDMIRNAKNQYKDCAIYGILRKDYINKHTPDSAGKLL